ncbi:MAG TPA: type II toxin-antitoxin system prevent-host-death family antitoxin, partial [Mycobacteriales bacterium]|nr:type II toxin-antitoxin system prevent-host-death family antitoxin [Mycobacteriales bacterium]
MRTISQRELRNDFSAVLRAVENSETFIVTKNGTPVAELRPLRRCRFVPTDEWIAKTRHLPPIDVAEVRADIDRDVDPGNRLMEGTPCATAECT